MSWIKDGAEYIEGARYVLEGFHLRRAIFTAASADETKMRALSQEVYNGKRTEMNRLLTALREEAEADSRKSAILEVQKHLNNQWPGIRARRKNEHILDGSSAEGNERHV